VGFRDAIGHDQSSKLFWSLYLLQILVLDRHAPTPDRDAGSLQTYLALKTGEALGYRMHFSAPDGLAAVLDRHSPDVVMAYRADVLGPALPLLPPAALLLYHVADLHHLRMARMAALTGDDDLRAAAASMRAREWALVKAADVTITHSCFEADVIAQACPGARVAHWPLMVEPACAPAPYAARRDVCFLGGYRHAPNIDAVAYFVRDIWPLLREAVPEMRFVIAGADAPPEIIARAGPNIVVAGHVKDLSRFLNDMRVFVCPLRAGAGVKGKIATALGHGIPVVTTSQGVEGAELAAGRDVLVADAPGAFAREVLRVYRDAALWRDLSHAGQAAARENFSLARGARAFAAAIAEARAHRAGRRVENAVEQAKLSSH